MALVCISPETTRTFEYWDGGSFEIGVVPRDIMAKIQNLLRQNKEIEAWVLAVKYGVKGHSGLEFSDGKEVPFGTEVDNQKRVVLKEETVNIYYASGVLEYLGSEALKKGGAEHLREIQNSLLAAFAQKKSAS